MPFLHTQLAMGGWSKLSLMDQLGNIGSEVRRARLTQGKDEHLFQGAVERALELFDLTLMDLRWKERLREINRAREVFCDAAYNNSREYNTSLADLDAYFFHFAYAARAHLLF